MAKYRDSNSDIVYSAIYSIRSNQWKIQNDQYDLLKSVKLLPESYPDFTFDNLYKLTAITTQASTFSHCYGIKTNKVFEALNLAFPLTTEENISRVMNGCLPSGYDNSIEKGQLPVLGAKDSYWGTSQATTITAYLRAIYYTVTKEKFGCGSRSDESGIFHTFDLPMDYDSSSVLECSYLHKPDIVWQLTAPHSGYSFGGDRSSIKQFRVEDCTSFLEKIHQLPPSSGSSADLYLAARSLDGQDISMAPSGWLDSTGGALVKLFNTSRVPDSGDIVASRSFSAEKPQASSLGNAGHAGIFLGNNGGEIVTLAYNRDMPGMEGFGLESRAYEDSTTKQTFFLKRNDIDFVPRSEKDLPFDFRDLNSFVSRIDDEMFVSGSTEEDSF